MTWAGWDKSEWALCDERSGVYLKPGLRGWGVPGVDRYASTSPALAGSRWRGSRTQEREVFWPLRVFSDAGSQAWLDYDSAFWRTMHPDRPGVWSVTQPNGTTRRLTCRFVDDGSATFDIDPALVGWTDYGVTLVAEQPFWTGDPITASWSNDGLAPFLGGPSGSGRATPFYISRGNTIGSAKMPNPGDVDAYPVWTIKGPASSVTVGVAGSTITYSVAIPTNGSVVIDTRPGSESVVDQDGNDLVGNLSGAVSFAPIPASEAAELSLSLAGTGSVSATIEPCYFRAW